MDVRPTNKYQDTLPFIILKGLVNEISEWPRLWTMLSHNTVVPANVTVVPVSSLDRSRELFGGTVISLSVIVVQEAVPFGTSANAVTEHSEAAVLVGVGAVVVALLTANRAALVSAKPPATQKIPEP